jgi:hypothetical protein
VYCDQLDSRRVGSYGHRRTCSSAVSARSAETPESEVDPGAFVQEQSSTMERRSAKGGEEKKKEVRLAVSFCNLWANAGKGFGRGSSKYLKRIGGPGRDRTDDLFHAMEARSQLRHRPTLGRERLSSFSTSKIDSSNTLSQSADAVR